MLAIRATDSGVFLDRDAPVPSPGPGEALVEPSSVLITDADLAVVRRELAFSGVMGSVFVGIVRAVSHGVDESLVGQRVTLAGPIVDSGSELSRRGLSQHEPARRLPGLLGADGAMAGRVVLPAASLVKVPDRLGDDRVLLAHLLAPAAQAVRLGEVRGGGYVTILGETPLALLTAQLAAKENAQVRLIAVRDAWFGLLERWGVRHRLVEEIGLRSDQNVVIECSGESGSIDAAIRMVRQRGTIVLMSSPLPVPGMTSRAGHAFDLMPVVLNELRVVGARSGSIAEGLRAASELDLDGLVTRRFPLEQAMDAFRAAANPDSIAVVVEQRGR